MNGPIALRKSRMALLVVALLLMACLLLVTSASAAEPDPATPASLGSPALSGPVLPDCHIYIKAKKFWDKNNNKTKDGDDVWLSGWEITLTKPDGSTIKKTTNSYGVADFGSFTAAGTYKLTETMQSGWTNTTDLEQTKYFGASGPDVNWTAYFGNWQVGTIIVREVTDPSPDPTNTSFPYTLTGVGLTTPFSLTNGTSQTFNNLVPGTYSVTPGTIPSIYMWILKNSYCSDGSLVSAIGLSGGETVTCTFIHCLCSDFGDAPDDGVQYHYNTLLANDGARHAIGNIWLGATKPDYEDDAALIPASPAKGDDMTDDGDEDGVDRGKDPWDPDKGWVYVTVTGGDGCLNAWWDITQPGPSGVMAGSNGYFDANDHIITNYPVVAGVNTVNFNFPAEVVPFEYETVGATYVRFRLSPRNATGSCTTTLASVGLEPDAASASVGPNGSVLNGEVEDYQWGFGSNAVSLQGLTAASQVSRSAGLPLLGVAAILVSGLAVVWNRQRKAPVITASTTVQAETGKTYAAPAIVHEMDLETRAGSPLGAQEFNPVLGPEFQEVK